MTRSTLFALASTMAFVAVPAIAMAEDSVKADPKHYTVEFENDRVRVIRVKYGPGEKSVMHTHGPNVAVMLTDAKIRMHMPDGSHVDIDDAKGSVTWAESEKHLPENLSKEPVEVVLVELKDQAKKP